MLTGPEIFEKIQENEKSIKEIFENSTFVLEPRIIALRSEINALRAECPHEFKDGECVYCGRPEVIEDDTI